MKFSTFGFRPHLSFVTSALLLAALVFAVFALAAPGTAQAQQATTDYDADDDALIEVSSLAQLNAIRWDLDGDGTPASSNASDYAAAFPNPAAGMGCPATGCTGYELTANLDFDTDGSGDTNDADDYWNGGSGWLPVGDDGSDNVFGNADDNAFLATFEGNGNVISNLFISRGGSNRIGLFGVAGSAAVIRNLGLADVSVKGSWHSGGLVGSNGGSITTSYVTGSVMGNKIVGGLAGSNGGSITASYADVAVIASGADNVGGLVGWNSGGDTMMIGSSGASITASYATGSVSGNDDVGGLVGTHSSSDASITASYATGSVSGNDNVGGLVGEKTGTSTVSNSYWDTQTSGQASSAGGTGKITAELRAPTGNTGIYADWDADLWDFGTAHDYPALKADTDGDGTATWQEFGKQRTDYDTDDDGLIEVGSLAQLNALRWDTDGDGMPVGSSENHYAAAFSNRAAGMGCPASGCVGYELTADLDFDTDGSGGANDADAYWNGGSGWEPIMDFEATLEGNGHAIANLFIDRVDDYLAGLFGSAGPGAVIRNLTLTGVSVTGDESVAGLAGENEGSISGVSVSGSVSGEIAVGGLAGYNAGSIVSGAAGGTVTGYTGEAGGLVGYNDGTIRSSSATAAVSAPAGGVGREMGGLAGHNAGTITASHATGSVSGHSETGGLVGGNGSSGTITASYATGGVTGNASAGGLVGGNSGLVSASYATGVVSGAANAGGLVGLGTRGAVSNSYYDQETSGRAFGIGSDDLDNDNTVDEEEVTDASGRKAQESNTLPGSATAEMQTPTDYTGIYETWDDHDVDGDGSADAPWDFGSSNDYPTLRSGL